MRSFSLIILVLAVVLLSSATFSSAQTSSRNCPDGTVCLDGSVCTPSKANETTSYTCEFASVFDDECPNSPCAPGSYCQGGNPACIVCWPSVYCPAGTRWPVNCAAGTYCPFSNMTYSIPCPDGSISSGVSVRCEKCPFDFFFTNNARHSRCDEIKPVTIVLLILASILTVAGVTFCIRRRRAARAAAAMQALKNSSDNTQVFLNTDATDYQAQA